MRHAVLHIGAWSPHQVSQSRCPTPGDGRVTVSSPRCRSYLRAGERCFLGAFMAATTTPGRKWSGLLGMHGPCQANSSASSPHSHSLPATSSVALPQAPLLYSTHARVRSRGHRPIRPCLANRLRPHRELFCFFAGGFLFPCERISPPPLLAVGRSPQPSPLHWLHLHHVTLLATKWQSAIASVRQSHDLLHDPAALPTL